MLVNTLAKPGDTIDLHLPSIPLKAKRLTPLVTTQNLKIIQLLIPAGENIPTHEAEGEIILHCLIGAVSVKVAGQTDVLKTGQLLYLEVNEPFSVHGIECSSVLVTIIAPKEGRNTELIGGSKPR